VLALGDNLEENTPVSYSQTKSWQALQSANVAAERILLHFPKSGDDSFSITLLNTVK